MHGMMMVLAAVCAGAIFLSGVAIGLMAVAYGAGAVLAFALHL